MQQFFDVATGYMDCNDHDMLPFDPALKTGVGRLPDTGPSSAFQPTLSRFENQVGTAKSRGLRDALIEACLAAHPRPHKLIVLDMDSTDDFTNGNSNYPSFTATMTSICIPRCSSSMM